MTVPTLTPAHSALPQKVLDSLDLNSGHQVKENILLGNRSRPVMWGLGILTLLPLKTLSRMLFTPLGDPVILPSLFPSLPTTIFAPSPPPLTYWAIPRWECAALGGHRPRCDLLGRALSSQAGCGLLVPEAEDRKRRTHEQPQQGWRWKH